MDKELIELGFKQYGFVFVKGDSGKKIFVSLCDDGTCITEVKLDIEELKSILKILKLV